MSSSFDNNEWRKNSTKGLVCGIMLCRNSPRNQCSKCSIDACNEHVTSHIHTDTFQDLQKEKQ